MFFIGSNISQYIRCNAAVVIGVSGVPPQSLKAQGRRWMPPPDTEVKDDAVLLLLLLLLMVSTGERRTGVVVVVSTVVVVVLVVVSDTAAIGSELVEPPTVAVVCILAISFVFKCVVPPEPPTEGGLLCIVALSKYFQRKRTWNPMKMATAVHFAYPVDALFEWWWWCLLSLSLSIIATIFE